MYMVIRARRIMTTALGIAENTTTRISRRVSGVARAAVVFTVARSPRRRRPRPARPTSSATSPAVASDNASRARSRAPLAPATFPRCRATALKIATRAASRPLAAASRRRSTRQNPKPCGRASRCTPASPSASSRSSCPSAPGSSSSWRSLPRRSSSARSSPRRRSASTSGTLASGKRKIARMILTGRSRLPSSRSPLGSTWRACARRSSRRATASP